MLRVTTNHRELLLRVLFMANHRARCLHSHALIQSESMLYRGAYHLILTNSWGPHMHIAANHRGLHMRLTTNHRGLHMRFMANHWVVKTSSQAGWRVVMAIGLDLQTTLTTACYTTTVILVNYLKTTWPITNLFGTYICVLCDLTNLNGDLK
jgi:hypothetical protein